MEYKNFIPKEYVDNLKLKKVNFFNKVIIIFIIVNLVLLPKSINKIYEINKSVEVIDLDLDIMDYSKKELIEILDLFDLNIGYLEIKDGNGIIKIKDREEIFDLDRIINIKSIDKESDGYYILGIELWRKNSC